MDLLDKISSIYTDSLMDLEKSSNPQEIDLVYLKYFSKKNGVITLLLKDLSTLSYEEKKLVGPKINNLRDDLKSKIEEKRRQTHENEIDDTTIDLTIKVESDTYGILHPTTQVIREINNFFRYYGFSIVEGPEIETEEYNFRKLNLPEGHPATDLQDTLYVNNDILLRTHTSSIEARIISTTKPPIRVAFPGRVYRNETLNTTNGAFFHQYQGVVVEKNTNLQHLKGILQEFHKFLFGDDVELRYRYKYYPEVSPGMGMDMKCKFCNGKGCVVCKHRGWIEVLGSGMIHYNTLKMCGIDPEEYVGFAFGMGLDRLVMQRFGIKDLRYLYGGGVYK